MAADFYSSTEALIENAYADRKFLSNVKEEIEERFEIEFSHDGVLSQEIETLNGLKFRIKVTGADTFSRAPYQKKSERDIKITASCFESQMEA